MNYEENMKLDPADIKTEAGKKMYESYYDDGLGNSAEYSFVLANILAIEAELGAK